MPCLLDNQGVEGVIMDKNSLIYHYQHDVQHL